MLPSSLKRWLERKQAYLRIRYSKPVIKLWLLFRADTRKELNRQRRLYLGPLTSIYESPKLVFDIGAHEGFLTAIFADEGYTVVAVEPDKRNMAILRARFGKHPNIRLLEAAVSDSEGTLVFFASPNEAAFGTLSEKWKEIREEEKQNAPAYPPETVTVNSTTLEQLIADYGKPVFIKIDVEGHEEKTIAALSQSVPLISFEAILPQFLQETINCIERLGIVNRPAVFNYSVNNEMVYSEFASKDKILGDIVLLPSQTIEIFCKRQ